jgi:hypothetical protein
MARERIEFEVDGVGYNYRQLSPTKATLIFLKLVKIFGPLVGKMYGGEKNVSLDSAKDMAGDVSSMSFDALIEVVVDRVDEDQLMLICRKLLADCRPANAMTLRLDVEKDLDKHLEETPGMMHFFKLMKEVLQLQYADFFDGLRTLDGSEEVQGTTDTQSPRVP